MPPEDRDRFAISDDEILTLARWACMIEDHYSAKRGQPTPMDMEWAKDGRTGELFIVQARPETVQSQKQPDTIEVYTLQVQGPRARQRPQRRREDRPGPGARDQTGAGPASVPRRRCARHRQDRPGLGTDHEEGGGHRHRIAAAGPATPPSSAASWACRPSSAPSEAPRSCTTASSSRSPAPRARRASSTKACSTSTSSAGPSEAAERPKTKIMMNVGNPEAAFRLSFAPQRRRRPGPRGVHHLHLHQGPSRWPCSTIDRLDDPAVRAEIDRADRGLRRQAAFFVDKLAQGVAMIARGVLSQGRDRPPERLQDQRVRQPGRRRGVTSRRRRTRCSGFRGASRYYDPRYRDGFALECRAMKKVRDEMGLTNVKLMIPFCRTVEEGQRVMAEMAKHGLKRGENGLEVYVMCEIPSNVILAEDFAEIFDGFSIGSNDLTQLVLGVDRDSADRRPSL